MFRSIVKNRHFDVINCIPILVIDYNIFVTNVKKFNKLKITNVKNISLEVCYYGNYKFQFIIKTNYNILKIIYLNFLNQNFLLKLY